MIKRFSDHSKKCVALGFFATVFGLILSQVLPSWERRFYDWQLTLTTSFAENSPIVILGIEGTSFTTCAPGVGEGSGLARVMATLGQAGAMAIAPVWSMKNMEGCQDATTQAKLIEATRQAGPVVYPRSIPIPLSVEAERVGHLMIEPDPDGVVRRVRPFVQEEDHTIPALGVAIASVVNHTTLHFSDSQLKDKLVNFQGRWEDSPFPIVPLSHLTALMEERRWQEFRDLVRGKILLLTPVNQDSPTLRTPLEPTAPTAFFHANVIHSALTHSWLTRPSFPFVFLMILPFGIAAAWLGLTQRGWWTGGGLLGLFVIFFAISQTSFLQFHTVFPLVPALLTLPLAIGSALLWSYLSEKTQGLTQAEQELARLKEELTQKELTAQRLKRDLGQVQQALPKSTHELQNQRNTTEVIQRKWEAAQAEIRTTKFHVQVLEREITQLRSQPRPVNAETPRASLSGPGEIQQECAELGILTQDPKVFKVLKDLKKAAQTHHPILLFGETGTGKELFAKAVHHFSPRSKGPFIPVNMAALQPELFESELFGHVKGAFTGAVGRSGLLEAAQRGTLFLDEIGDLGLALQAKLLRVLEDGTFHRVGESKLTKVDVRIVAATHKDLRREVEENRFRADLFYRLRSFVLKLPTLRERSKEDLCLLTDHFMKELALQTKSVPLQVAPEALNKILGYGWPGNIRELRHTLAQAVTFAESHVVSKEDLQLEGADPHPPLVENRKQDRPPAAGKAQLKKKEDETILKVLRQNGFDIQASARALEWDRNTVTQRLKGIGFQALADHQGDLKSSAASIADNHALANIVEEKLKEYYHNLILSSIRYPSAEQAIAACRRRMKNVPERFFPAVETLIRQHFADQRP